MANLISSVLWVKRGLAAQQPSKYAVDEEELERISALERVQLEDARLEIEKMSELASSMGIGVRNDDDDDEWVDENSDEEGSQDQDKMDTDASAPDDPEDLSKYNLDDYDKDETSKETGIFSNIKGLTYYKDNTDDPYITLKDDEEEEERAELEVSTTDNMIVAAKTEDDVAQLEVYIYDEGNDNLYVHHDLMLASLPLCLEWLDFPPASSIDMPSKPGNFVAVGSMDPEIEIWSLDVVDSLYPDAVLGRRDKTNAHIPTPLGTGKKKKKKNKAREIDSEHHVDAVLGLSWNRTHRNLLASASADKTVKLWDLSRDLTSGAIRSINVHKDKVQAVHWNTVDPTVLLTGSYDRTVRVFDSRASETALGALLGSDVEALLWDPWDSHCFFVSLENGIVLNFDARNLSSSLNTPSKPLFTLAAHDAAVSALDINPHIKGCLVTGGTDKIVKIWNINEKSDKRDVSLVISRDLGIGKVFTAAWSLDDPLTIAAGGSKGALQVWDVSSNGGVRKTFASKLQQAGIDLKEKSGDGVVRILSDDEDESDDDE